MGGCGMVKPQKKPVINSNGKFHHLNNVYVFDGSAFSTVLAQTHKNLFMHYHFGKQSAY
jgi:choline dehydrogenase-like flavoprotein